MTQYSKQPTRSSRSHRGFVVALYVGLVVGLGSLVGLNQQSNAEVQASNSFTFGAVGDHSNLTASVMS